MFKKFLIYIVIFISVGLLYSCQKNNKEEEKMDNKAVFGKLTDGREVIKITLKNSKGSSADIINYGATVVNLLVPDKSGKLADIVHGYDDLNSYLTGSSYFGCIVGRYGNRIGEGKFELDGKKYQLTINDGKNSLHGGKVGFDKVLWNIDKYNANSVTMSYLSPDGEEGFPGEAKISVTYTLTDDNELKLYYEGTTNKPTIFNPTHHSYFNLTGDPKNTILDHVISINADRYTPVDGGLIPTGELAPVEGTVMDLRKPVKIGAGINADFQQLKYAGGYDHNWVLNDYDGTVKVIATVYDSTSGRFMEVLSDEPGLQFYSGNFLNGAKGKNGQPYNHRTGLCLEAQHYPDSPNKSNFPSVVLKPGEVYKQTTIYKFLIK